MEKGIIKRRDILIGNKEKDLRGNSLENKDERN
jgi:hypothetical protein